MRRYIAMTEKQLKSRVGSLKQIAGIRTSALDDGIGRGMRVADVNNGSGLAYTVLLDRGMDIGQAYFMGIPLAFISPAGYAHPSYYEPEGFRWLRNWGGGLLTSCGLTNVGTPEKSDDFKMEGPLGLHGRLSNIPAEKCGISEKWAGDEYQLSVSGCVRQSSFFGENLELTRVISTAMGDNTITICDKVLNNGFRPSPVMLLYHINIGFPLLSENVTLSAREHELKARTPNAEKGISAWRESQLPTEGYQEQCFYHDIPEDEDGMARMKIENPELELSLEVAYRKKELPFFTQWKMMGEGEYVMGLEPANCHPDGQKKEKAEGTLRVIEPGEIIEFLVRISIAELSG